VVYLPSAQHGQLCLQCAATLLPCCMSMPDASAAVLQASASSAPALMAQASCCWVMQHMLSLL
jgi:hypothetical protein